MRNNFRFLLPLRLLVLASLLAAAGPARAETVDLLLAAAGDAELQPLIAQLGSPHTTDFAAWHFWVGTLHGKKVALTRTEGDPLNAVASTTLGIRHFSPRLVIIFGTARPHDPALHAGDVVLSEKFVAFDGIVSPRREPGQGSDALTWERLPHALMTPGEREKYVDSFPADTATLALAKKISASPLAPSSASAPAARLLPGVLGSAPQFNAEADRLAWLHRTWGTSCEDADSAPIAGCAQLLGVPVFGLRVIQRLDTPPGSSAPYMQPGMIDSAAAQTSAQLVLRLVEALP